MPLTGKGQKILDSMRETYGDEKKAKAVFYASINKGKIKGAEGKMKEDQRKTAQEVLEKLGQELYRRRQQAKRAKEAAEAVDYLQREGIFRD